MAGWSPVPWLAARRARAAAFLDWLPRRIGPTGQATMLSWMLRGVGLAWSLAAITWAVVWVNQPTARSRAWRILLERQEVTADLSAEALRRGATQIARQAAAVEADESLPEEEKAARLTDLRTAAMTLGARHYVFLRVTAQTRKAAEAIPPRLTSGQAVVDPWSGLRVGVTTDKLALQQMFLGRLSTDPREARLRFVAARWARPGAGPMPIPDASSEFER